MSARSLAWRSLSWLAPALAAGLLLGCSKEPDPVPPSTQATPAQVEPAEVVVPAASAPPGILPEVGTTTAGDPSEQGTKGPPPKLP